MSGKGATITTTFAGAPTSFGIDLLEFSGYPDRITATVFDTKGNVLYTRTGIAVTGASPIFFGYQSAGGIGHANFSATLNGISPVIDNPTFGNGGTTSVSEPGSTLPNRHMSHEQYIPEPAVYTFMAVRFGDGLDVFPQVFGDGDGKDKPRLACHFRDNYLPFPGQLQECRLVLPARISVANRLTPSSVMVTPG